MRVLFPRIDRSTLIVLLLVVLFAGVTLFWLTLDHSPPSWDEADYLTASLNLFDALTDHGIVGFAARFSNVSDRKAPLLAALATPVYLVLGRHYRHAYLINVLLTPVLLLSLYGIAIRIGNPRVGIIAVFIAGTMPLLYALARWYMVEYALTTIVALFIWLLLMLTETPRIRIAVGAGAVAGLGMLCKDTFPLYVGAVLLVIVACMISARKLTTSLVLAAALPAAILPLSWYADNWRKALQHGVDSAYSAHVATLYGTGPVFSLGTLTSYGKRVVDGISPYYLLVGIALVIAVVLFRSHRTIPRRAFALLLAWLAPACVFLFAVNKDARFLAPLLPALALLLALLADALCCSMPKWAPGLLALLAIYPATGMCVRSFRSSAEEIGYVRHYHKQHWPHAEIVKTLDERGPFDNAGNTLVVVGTDVESLNSENLRLAATEQRLPLQIVSGAWQDDRSVPELSAVARLVYLDSSQPDPTISPRWQALIKTIREDSRFTELGGGFSLPGLGTARILAQTLPDPRENLRIRAVGMTIGRFDELHDLSIVFDDAVELTGIAFSRSGNSVLLSYRWQCLRPVKRDYLCFTHLLSGQDQVSGYLDHSITNGVPAMTRWTPGQTFSEALELTLPPGAVPEPLRMKIGLYHPQSGERMHIKRATPPAALKVVDDGTAVQFQQNY